MTKSKPKPSLRESSKEDFLKDDFVNSEIQKEKSNTSENIEIEKSKRGRPHLEEKHIQTTLYINREIKDKLEIYCFCHRMKISNIVNELLEHFLEDKKEEIENLYQVMKR